MEEELRQLGLTESERRVFTALVQLGSAKASQIAAKSKIERQAVYYSLKLLIEKGLVSETIKSGVKHYQSADLSGLVDDIDREAQKKKDAVEEINSQVRALRGAALQRPKVEQYEGLPGLKSAVRELLDDPAHTLYSYNSEKIISRLELFVDNYAAKRLSKNKKAKILCSPSKKIEELQRTDTSKMRELRTLSSLLERKDFALSLSSEKVVFIRSNENDSYALKIEDEEFAKFQIQLFEKLWSLAKK